MNGNWNPNQGGFNPNFPVGMNQNAFHPGMNTDAFGPGINTSAYNPGINTCALNPAVYNPFNLTLPTVQFHGGCSKCHGAGFVSRKGHNYPCRKCYKKCGFCMYCYGSRILFMTGQPCTYCQNGHYMKRQKSHGHGHGHGHGHSHGKHGSSSSSDSDW